MFVCVLCAMCAMCSELESNASFANVFVFQHTHTLAFICKFSTSPISNMHVNCLYSQMNRDGREIEINVCKNKGRVSTDYSRGAVTMLFKSNVSCGNSGKQTTI